MKHAIIVAATLAWATGCGTLDWTNRNAGQSAHFSSINITTPHCELVIQKQVVGQDITQTEPKSVSTGLGAQNQSVAPQGDANNASAKPVDSSSHKLDVAPLKP